MPSAADKSCTWTMSALDSNENWVEGDSYTAYSLTPGLVETSVDVVTPNFKSRIANGEIINNPCTLTRIETLHPSASYYEHRTTKRDSGNKLIGYHFEGDYVPFSGWGSGTQPALLTKWDAFPNHLETRDQVYNLAVTAAHANVDESEMLALASLAEGRKTVDSLLVIARRVNSILRNVRKLNIAEVRKELSAKELAGRYMEMRYALRPLMYDMVQCADAVMENRSHTRRTYRGFNSQTLNFSDVVQSNPAYETSCEIIRTITMELSCRAGVMCDVDVEALATFGIDQLAESLWELVPFSFIADWFFNIGDTIAAYTPNAGITQRASWATVREVVTATNSAGTVGSTAPSFWDVENYSSMAPFTYSTKHFASDRITDPSVSLWPQSKLRLDGFKLLDLGIIGRGILS